MKGRDEPVKNKFVSAIAPNVTAAKHQKRRQIATQSRSIPKKGNSETSRLERVSHSRMNITNNTLTFSPLTCNARILGTWKN